MRPAIVLLIAFIVASNVEAELFEELFEEKWHELLAKQEWELFKVDHDKTYENEDEEHLRREIYLTNKKKIDEHNEKYAQGLVTFELGVNQFTDMLHEEIMSTMTGAIVNVTELSSAGSIFISPANVQAPSKVDWRESGAVTEVKIQGTCGCCWAFSTTGAVEGQIFRQKQQLISLSEQNLMDCSRNQNYGCHGGNPINAYEYISRNRGIDTESSYPYEGRQASCRFSPRSVGATVRAYKRIPSSNERILMEAVATVGPISVVLDASPHSFSGYRGGVYYDPHCSNHLNHAVLAVGYGTDEKGMDYWLVKNSWGSRWGENGYMRLARNRQNHCGVATFPTFPLV